ncbi:hypothetical protein MCOL2_19656 [Listeria fleischmannii FSL S10-1203]|uniref:Uncharacterized protein n=1 Tax=Listeria fleischmannii FSL S10-1203 TaxID=1265822 RepID=W7D629_9LIST|nr:hypothetical protein MCOL2_19656 [Listeria fleischmannii FSL S10-1203]
MGSIANYLILETFFFFVVGFLLILAIGFEFCVCVCLKGEYEVSNKHLAEKRTFCNILINQARLRGLLGDIAILLLDGSGKRED